jgi:exonuclease III
MRVLHVMAGAREGGAENIMLEGVMALADAGVAQAVVTRADNEFRLTAFRDKGIRVATASFNKLWPFATQAAIAKLIREFKPDVAEYTWWSNRGQARANDVGWRIDYQIATPELAARARKASIYLDQRFSDHAPLMIDFADAR